jgi:hypothetical protein
VKHPTPLLALLLLVGCGSVTPAETSTTCVPGASVACTGVGGCAGAQICAADGRGLNLTAISTPPTL